MASPIPPTVRLNNYLQSIGQVSSLSYREKDNGPSASPEKRWSFTVKFDGQELGSCTGPRKSVAREAAAELALKRLRIE